MFDFDFDVVVTLRRLIIPGLMDLDLYRIMIECCEDEGDS